LEKQLDPENLTRLAAEGDRSSWEQIVNKHQQAVFRLAYLKLGDADEAADITQETFIRAWQNIKRYDPAYSLQGWLLGIAINLARNRHRSLGRYWHYLSQYFQRRELWTDSKEPVGDDKELLWQAVRQLPDEFQEIIYLRYFLEIPVRECAESLRIAPGTVKSRLSRALTALETLILQEYPELADEWQQ
jgi:RNA polymerase sigma-70 factor (ECF subfamily)